MNASRNFQWLIKKKPAWSWQDLSPYEHKEINISQAAC